MNIYNKITNGVVVTSLLLFIFSNLVHLCHLSIVFGFLFSSPTLRVLFILNDPSQYLPHSFFPKNNCDVRCESDNPSLTLRYISYFNFSVKNGSCQDTKHSNISRGERMASEKTKKWNILNLSHGPNVQKSPCFHRTKPNISSLKHKITKIQNENKSVFI